MLDLPCLQSYSVHSISSRDGILSVSPVMFSAYHLQQRRYTLFMLSLCHLMQIQYTLFVSSLCLQSCSVPPAETVCSLCLQSCSVHVTSSRDGILSVSSVMFSACHLQQRRYTLCVSSHVQCMSPPAETVYSLCLQSCSVHVTSSRDGILSVSPVMFSACHLQQRRYTLCVSSHVQCMSPPAETVYSLCLQSCSVHVTSSRDGILSVSPVMFSAYHLQQRRYTLFMLSLCHLMQIQYTLFVSSLCLQSCSVPPAETVCSLCLQSCSVHVTSSRDGILSVSSVMFSACHLQQRRYTLCVSSHVQCMSPPAETVYSLCLQSCSVHVTSSRDGILSVSPVMFSACHLQQRRYTLCVSSHVQCMSPPAETVYSLCLQSCSVHVTSSRDGILSLSPVMLQQRRYTLFVSSHVRCMHCPVLALFVTCAQLCRPKISRGSQCLDRVCQCSVSAWCLCI